MNSEASELWEKVAPDKALVKNALRLAHRDIGSAGRELKVKDYDWAFAISYNAMLQAGRALMYSQGFRPKSSKKHFAVVSFVKLNFSKQFAERLLSAFDRTRVKRHKVVYEEEGAISEAEAEVAVSIAEEFVEKVEALLKDK